MRYETSLTIAAPAERVWALLSDVTRWPAWTPTVTSVETEGHILSVGRTVRVKQPGRRATSYTVLDIHDGRSFV